MFFFFMNKFIQNITIIQPVNDDLGGAGEKSRDINNVQAINQI